MVNNISDVTNKIIDLDTAIVNNVDAMNEVNNGTCESANAIQNQLLKTKQIQNNIDEVKDASITIQNDVNKAVSDINNGQELITLLKRVTHHCEDDGKLVADELNRFKEYTNKINSIIDLITNKDLINVVKSLEISNTAIIESIQTVSSITEEVAAHSNETLNSSEQNKDVVSNIKSIIEDLNESANNLNNI